MLERTPRPGPTDAPPCSPAAALAAWFLAAAALAGLSPLLYALLGHGAVAVVQLAFIAGPALLATRRPGEDARALGRRLGLRLPSPRALVAGSLLGTSIWLLSAALLVPLVMRLPGAEAELARLERGVLGADHPLPVLLALVALVPALCEELLLRGVVLRALQPRLGSARAILAASLLFALLHLSVIRFAPVAVFGLVLGAAAMASRSTLTAMWVHLLNNTFALCASRLGNDRGLPASLDTPAVIAAASASTALGLWLLWCESRRPRARELAT
jgi:membrane protease YdiL (CAAX protease family)